jgi:DNA helicase-2/ATP-dependent DNA helicase PcrA
LKVSELIQEVINTTGILSELEEEDTIELQTRIENIKELLSLALEYEQQVEQQESSLDEDDFYEEGLEGFLGHVALVSDIDRMDEDTDRAALMTLHSAKGLEFPVVFMVGMEEGVFPGYRSMGEESELEEERRLCYVGITRAMRKLYMTSTRMRMLYGNTAYNRTSRFLREIPDELIDIYGKEKQNAMPGAVKKAAVVDAGANSAAGRTGFSRGVEDVLGYIPGGGFKKNLPQKGAVSTQNFSVGDVVEHKKFGVGVIMAVEKEAEDYKLDIHFEKAGMKRLMAAFANLNKIG